MSNRPCPTQQAITAVWSSSSASRNGSAARPAPATASSARCAGIGISLRTPSSCRVSCVAELAERRHRDGLAQAIAAREHSRKRQGEADREGCGDAVGACRSSKHGSFLRTDLYQRSIPDDSPEAGATRVPRRAGCRVDAPMLRQHDDPAAKTGKSDREDSEAAEAQQRSSPSGKVVYKAILNEAEEELERPSSALFWSGLAAGLSMGFSLVA